MTFRLESLSIEMAEFTHPSNYLQVAIPEGLWTRYITRALQANSGPNKVLMMTYLSMNQNLVFWVLCLAGSSSYLHPYLPDFPFL